MDWIAVSAIAEIVGAIAVVLTLAYLATQVNHGTQAARRAAAADGHNYLGRRLPACVHRLGYQLRPRERCDPVEQRYPGRADSF